LLKFREKVDLVLRKMNQKVNHSEFNNFKNQIVTLSEFNNLKEKQAILEKQLEELGKNNLSRNSSEMREESNFDLLGSNSDDQLARKDTLIDRQYSVFKTRPSNFRKSKFLKDDSKVKIASSFKKRGIYFVIILGRLVSNDEDLFNLKITKLNPEELQVSFDSKSAKRVTTGEGEEIERRDSKISRISRSEESRMENISLKSRLSGSKRNKAILKYVDNQ
jgi:hypothetical protein